MGFKIQCIIWFFLVIRFGTIAQLKKIMPNKMESYTGFQVGSTDQHPLFLHTLQNGIFPQNQNTAFLGINVHKDFDSLYTQNQKLKKWAWAYGLSSHINVNSTSKILLPEAYFKARLGVLEFYGGRRREIQGQTDTTLTSGAYVWSGNALAVPKIQIHTPGWWNWGKRVAVKGGLAHGWFGTQGNIENFYVHQKCLYLKLQDKAQKVQLIGGINHQAQWGGYSEELGKITGPFAPTLNGYLAPDPWYSYQFLILPFLQKIVPPDRNRLPGYDAGLAIGNQLGSVDLGAIIFHRFHFYHQKPFDFARSLINFNNLEDGIYGFSWKANKKENWINHWVFEFIYTKSQGRYRFGKLMESNKGEGDNYFSHGQYSSWTYQGRILGHPFFLVDSETRSIVSNRTKAFYTGFMGQKKNWNYTLNGPGLKIMALTVSHTILKT
jgi:hypothetical protein